MAALTGRASSDQAAVRLHRSADALAVNDGERAALDRRGARRSEQAALLGRDRAKVMRQRAH